LSLLVFARGRLGDFARLQAASAHGEALDAAVNPGADILQVGPECALVVSDHAAADAAEFLGQAATADASAGHRALPTDLALSGHANLRRVPAQGAKQ